MASPAGVFSLFYLIYPFHEPSAAALVSVFWIANLRIFNDAAEATPRNNRVRKSTARVTITAGQLAEA
jgi:hypothetical protein